MVMLTDDDVYISRSELALVFPNPRVLDVFEKTLQIAQATPTAVNDAQDAADAATVSAATAQATATSALSAATTAQATADAIAAAQFVVMALSGALSNERVLTGSAGVTVNTGTPGQVIIQVSVATALGYTPANKAGDTIGPSTFTGNIDVQAEARCDTLRIDQTATATATASTHSIPVNVNGTVMYMRLSATP